MIIARKPNDVEMLNKIKDLAYEGLERMLMSEGSEEVVTESMEAMEEFEEYIKNNDIKL